VTQITLLILKQTDNIFLTYKLYRQLISDPFR